MKTFSQFMYESGGYPYQPYRPAPPGTNLAMKEDTGSLVYGDYIRERKRRTTNLPVPTQLNKERKLAYMLQKDLPPPEYRSSAT